MTNELTPAGLRRLAEDFRARHRPDRVRALLVAGSGLEFEVPGWQAGETIPFGDIFPFPIQTLKGHSETLTLWRRREETLLVMNGRLHLYQGYRPEEVVAPVRLAALLGAEMMIATNATGAADPAITPGSIVVITDHLNLQGRNPLVGPWAREFGTQFPDMSRAYDPELIEVARRAASAAGFEVFEGVYAGVLGPSFETPAEVRMLRGLGASVIGMSTVPEVIAARHMGLRVVALSLATNPAAGITAEPLSHEDVLEAGKAAAGRLRELVRRLVEELIPDQS
ncbi:MAG: purine-nucleoside phosphorylase [Acidobacteria bacterium]|nr:purine-nucleoside phosphorylase [Acidobacteriota bacterium]